MTRTTARNAGIAKVAATLAAAIVVIAVVTSLRAPSTQHIKVAVMTWGGAGPGFVAKRLGMFGDLDVEIVVIDDSTARQAAFASNEYELYLTNPDQHARERQQGLPGNMVLITDISLGADGLLVGSGIRSLADLRGKRIAYTRGSASDYMLSKALEAAGLARSDVDLREYDDPSTTTKSLGSDVHAAISWEPLMSAAAADGSARVLFTSADVPDTIVGVFVAKDSLLHDQDRLHAFLNGWLKAVEYIDDEPEEAHTIIAGAFGVDAAALKPMMRGIRLADRDLNRRWFTRSAGGLAPVDRLVNDGAAHWLREKLMAGPVDPNARWVPAEVQRFFEAPAGHD